MTISRTLRMLAVALAVTAAALAVMVSPAFAEVGCTGCAPWWHLSSFSRPSYLQSGQGRDEIQEIRLTSDEGLYKLTKPGYPADSAFISAEAGAGEVQEQLEGGVYGAGNVRVKTAPGPAGGKAFRITFVGELEDQWISLGEAKSVEGAKVSVSEVTRGRPDGVIVVNASN